MTAADNVLTEQSDVSVRKSRSVMQIKFREWKVAEGDSEHTTDDEES